MTKNDGLQNQSVLYWLDSPAAQPRVLLDPNTLSADGTVALVVDCRVARRQAAGLRARRGGLGLDRVEGARRRNRQGSRRPPPVDASSPTPRGPPTAAASSTAATTRRRRARSSSSENYYQKLYYHRLGTAQEQDLLVYERRDHKDWGFGGTVTDDGRYLVIDGLAGHRSQEPASSTRSWASRGPSPAGWSSCCRASTPPTPSSATTGRCSGSTPTSTRRAAA